MRESVRKSPHAWCVCFGCDGLEVVFPGFFALPHGVLRPALRFGIVRSVTGRQQRTVMVSPRQVQRRFRLLKSCLLKVAALDFAHCCVFPSIFAAFIFAAFSFVTCMVCCYAQIMPTSTGAKEHG